MLSQPCAPTEHAMPLGGPRDICRLLNSGSNSRTRLKSQGLNTQSIVGCDTLGSYRDPETATASGAVSTVAFGYHVLLQHGFTVQS